jgi:hypothetical protein
MSDTAPPPESAAPPEPAQAPEAEPAKPETDWKTEAKKWESRAKENSTAAKRLAEIEEANKTETQKLADRAAAAEKAAEEARSETLRYRIASEFQLDAEQAAALEHVTSEDGMRLVAKQLAGVTADRKKNGNTVPKEGAAPTAAPDDTRAAVRELFSR